MNSKKHSEQSPPQHTINPKASAEVPLNTQRGKGKFLGTDNPRHIRAIAVLLRRPISREELDCVAGCANGPELVAELRRRGLNIRCDRIRFSDRDGKVCCPGIYSLSPSDRKKIYEWLRQRHKSD